MVTYLFLGRDPSFSPGSCVGPLDLNLAFPWLPVVLQDFVFGWFCVCAVLFCERSDGGGWRDGWFCFSIRGECVQRKGRERAMNGGSLCWHSS